MEPVEQYSRGPSKLAIVKSYAAYVAVGILFAALLAFAFILNEVLLYFTPKTAKNGSMSFIIMGDYGRNGAYNQTEVAKAMAQWCAKKTASGKCDFIVGYVVGYCWGYEIFNFYFYSGVFLFFFVISNERIT